MYKPILFDLFPGELITSFKTLSSHRRSGDGAGAVWTQLAQYDKKGAWKFEFPFILSLVILFFCYNQLRNSRKQSLNTNFLLFEVWQGRPESVSQLNWNGVVERHQLNCHFGAIFQTGHEEKTDSWWLFAAEIFGGCATPLSAALRAKHRSRRSDLALTSYPHPTSWQYSCLNCYMWKPGCLNQWFWDCHWWSLNMKMPSMLLPCFLCDIFQGIKKHTGMLKKV